MRETFTSGAAVGVPAGLAFEVDFDDEEHEEGGHHDDAGHSGVLVCEEVGETWVIEGLEGCWDELWEVG